MTTDAQQVIQRWLAKVPGGPPSQSSEPQHSMDPKLNQALHSTLEPTDTPGPAIRWPNIEKRFGDEQSDDGQHIHPKIAHNPFVKRPRRKTRDDKYEYKRTKSTGKQSSRSRRNNGKRPRTSRKHTMNDAFHASNVARERLTLRNTPSPGLFGKGKSSSPVSLRDGTAFSETQFLTRRARDVTETESWKHINLNESPLQKTLNGEKSRSKLSHYVFHEPPKLVNIEPLPAPRAQRSVLSSQGNQHSRPDSETAGLHPPASGSAPHRSPLNGQCSVEAARTPTPYFWSVSDRRSQRSREIEDSLLKTLHTGLSPDSDPKEDADPKKQYFNIQDLKTLLERRKTCWQPDSTSQFYSKGKDAIINEACGVPEMITKTSQVSQKFTLPQYRKSGATSVSGNRPSHELTSSDKPHYDHQHEEVQLYRDGDMDSIFIPPRGSCTPHLGSKSAKLEVEDDDTFFQRLDAAYSAILEPGCSKSEPTIEGPMSHNRPHLLASNEEQDFADVFFHDRALSPERSTDPASCDQLRLDYLPTFGNPSNPQRGLEESTYRMSGAHLNPLELHSTKQILAPGFQVQSNSQRWAPLPSQDAPNLFPRTPPEFWKQRRLF